MSVSTLFVGSDVVVRFDRVGEAILVTASRPTARDLLTPREHEVAEGFAGGETYKQLARRLDMSPATVRHHLRGIYAKLGLSDKAALARRMADSGE